MVFNGNSSDVEAETVESEAPERLDEENFPAILLEAGKEETAAQMKSAGFSEIVGGDLGDSMHQFVDSLGNIAIMRCTNETTEITDGTEAMLTQSKPKPELIYIVESFHKNHFEKEENIESRESLVAWGLKQNPDYRDQQGHEEYITHEGNRVRVSWRGDSGEGRVVEFYDISKSVF
ncbi:MAG: hypothetical protein WCI57_02745 [Candidatus Berkelbacteria bacterium]